MQPDDPRGSTSVDYSPRAVHVLFVDLVGYSLLPLEAQRWTRLELREHLRASRLQPDLLIDSGDGFAALFVSHVLGPVQCATDLASAFGTRIRMGIHSGPVVFHTDINDRPNASGSGINMAERVMNLGDPGHILASGAFRAIATGADEGLRFIDVGSAELKHGQRLQVYILVAHGAGIETHPSRLRRATPTKRASLPPVDREFVGRTHEIQRLRDALESERRRLVTITGPGGIGKTSLAIETASRVSDSFLDGAWFIDCYSTSDPSDLLPRIATTMDLGLLDPAEIRNALRGRQALIILDCLERLVASAPLIDELLKECLDLQFLVTSRIVLGLPRETEFVLGPMAMQSEKGQVAEAVALFVQSARAVDMEFSPGRGERETVERIARTVEGIPLLLVLAAGRIRYMTLDELAEQVETRRFDVLKRKRIGEDRHASSYSVVEDSFRLLGERERRFLLASSVFSGGFFMSDAMAVLGELGDVPDTIAELRDNSLLISSAENGHMRFRTLDVISEFLALQPSLEEEERLAERHANHFAARASKVREQTNQGQWSAVSGLFWADLPNYRRGYERAIQQADPDLICSYSHSLGRILMEAGARSDFLKLAQAAEPIARRRKDKALLIELLGLMGGVYRRDEDYARAEALWMERIHLCVDAGLLEEAADGWSDLIDIAKNRGERERLLSYLAEFDKLAHHLKDGQIRAQGIAEQAYLAASEGKAEVALTLLAEAESLCDTEHANHVTFHLWQSLAQSYSLLGKDEHAIRICIDGIPRTLTSRQRSYTGQLLLRLAQALERTTRFQEAANAISLAKSIPKSTSAKLRSQVASFVEAFSANHPELTLGGLENGEADWYIAVSRFVGSL